MIKNCYLKTFCIQFFKARGIIKIAYTQVTENGKNIGSV